MPRGKKKSADDGPAALNDAVLVALLDPHLTSFEGREVMRSTIAIRNAGDGLSEAMKFEPIELHQGQRVYVVLECDVSEVSFPQIKDTDALSRKHVLRAGAATLVDGAIVLEHITAQRDRIQRLREKAQGIERLDFDGADDDRFDDPGEGGYDEDDTDGDDD